MATRPNITYLIPDEEWLRTVRLRWDDDTFPLYHCFFGTISFRIGDREILGSGSFNASIADFAVGLAELLPELCDGMTKVSKFQQSDDMLEILFAVEDGQIKITHNLAEGQCWSCECSSLYQAVEEFIRSFTIEAAARIPDLFGWRDMGILRNFAAT